MNSIDICHFSFANDRIEKCNLWIHAVQANSHYSDQSMDLNKSFGEI